MSSQRARPGMWSGVGLVLSATVGAGVFLGTGFMAQELGPGAILLAWGVGAVIALCGARAYAAVAELVPRSGGEYRYLSELLHPALGWLSGWTSLLLGFAAAIGAAAAAAASYTHALVGGPEPRFVAAGVLVAFTTAHSIGLRTSRWTQDLLALLKAILIGGFAILGLALGHNRWPTWHPPSPPADLTATFARNLFLVGYAFTGWNTAAYAASEFRDPKRDVPRAMMIGGALVAVLYLAVNWVFVANLDPTTARAVAGYEQTRVTLAHLVAQNFLGRTGATAVSILAVIVFLSASSAMIYAGPRVFAAMAKDGFLPRPIAGTPGRPPVLAMWLQCLFGIIVVFAHRLQELIENVGAILTLFSALTVLSLFRVRLFRPDLPRPSAASLVAAAIYVACAAGMLWFALRGSPSLALWMGIIVVAAVVGWTITRRLTARRGARGD